MRRCIAVWKKDHGTLKEVRLVVPSTYLTSSKVGTFAMWHARETRKGKKRDMMVPSLAKPWNASHPSIIFGLPQEQRRPVAGGYPLVRGGRPKQQG